MLLNRMLIRNATFRARLTATVDEGRVRTWAEFADRVARLAGAMRELGVGVGDRVAAFGLNTDRYLEAQFATWWLGAVWTPMNTRWSEEENRLGIEDADISLAFTDMAMRPAALAAVWQGKGVPVIVMDGGADERLDHDRLIETTAPIAPADIGEDALAGVYFTGGTTGRSKGVMLTHQAIWCNSLAFQAVLGLTDRSSYLHAAPMFHLADGAMSSAAVMAGAAHHFVAAFRPDLVLAAIRDRRLTHALMVPTMIEMLIAAPEFSAEAVAPLEYLAFGGSPSTQAAQERMIAALPGALLLHVYGQSEMGPGVSALEPERQKIGDPKMRSVGRPISLADVRIVRADGGEAAVNEPGEIWARSPGQMAGYWRRPEETARALVDGWVRTGDIAYVDDDGYLYICDRAKDMIISGGENVFSAEVERVISLHPAVAMCAVIGVPDPLFGESVHAVLVLKEEGSIDQAELFAHCRKHIAGYKCPRSIEVREALPISGPGKIQKQTLREAYWPKPGAAAAR